jgi:RHS repeat-associated protein
VRDVVDSQGNILNHLSYDSFGNVTGESNPDVDFRFGYTGREFDEETGQYYYRARYYDSGVGRFISEDPIGFDAGDPNLYRYVLNSPANYTDPSGNNALGDAYNSFLTSDVTYNVANGADQFFAGFSDSVTFGGSTKLREGLYGETATRNHSGALFDAGNVTGDIATTPLGGAALKGPKWAKRVAQAYNRIGDARDLLEQAQSAKDIASGCGDLGDIITVAGGLASRRGKGRNNNSSGIGDTDLPSTPSPTSSLSPKTQELRDQILEGHRKGDLEITPNELKPETLQEGNISIDFKDGQGVNLRVETHPIPGSGGKPVRHANVEVTKKNRRGRNKVVKNIHIK